MVIKNQSLQLSTVKSGLSEVVRRVRRTGEVITITVDGEPAAQITPVAQEPRALSASDLVTLRALMDALLRIPRPSSSFDAVTLVSEGRR